MAKDQEPIFNGGKMYHIFTFDKDTKPPRYQSSFVSPEAEQALLHGTLYYKIDGSNGMVQMISRGEDESEKDPQFKIFQRLDTKGKEPKETLIALPEGKNVAAYEGHSYYYDEITLHVTGKKQIKRNKAMRELVQRHLDEFAGSEWTSVEWVGTMFNKTPNVPHPIALAVHKEQIVEGDGIVERTYEGMRKYLLEDVKDQPIEGFIIEHGGNFWKVRSDCFPTTDGAKDPFKENRESSRPPVFLV